MNRLSAACLSAAAASAVLLVSSAASAAAPPKIRFLDVDSASYGSFVGIYGTGFGADKGTVKFGSATSIEIPLWSDRLIIARVPAGASSSKVHVSTAQSDELDSASTLQVHAGTIYVVSSNGSDAGAGTETDPFQSLHKALSVLQQGDTVLIRAGSYDEQDASGTPLPALYFRPGQSGTLTAPITLRGYGAEVPVIRGSRDAAKNDPIVYVAADYIRLARLDINGENNASNGVSMTGSSVWAVGLDVHGFHEAGITSDEGTGVFLAANTVHDGGTRPNLDHGIILTGPGGTVRNNEIHDLPNGYGIFLQYPSQSAAKVFANFVHDVAGGGIGLARVGGGNQIFNNVVWKAGASLGCMCGLQVAYGSTAGETSSGDRIYYNTFAGPTRTGVLIADRAGAVALHGNLFDGFKAGLQVEDTGSESALSSSYNLWFGLGEEPLFKWAGPWIGMAQFQSTSQQESHSLVADPLLVDPEQGDLHLTASSPAIDVGGGPDQPPDDFDGLSRPQGVADDIGAYEFEGGAPHVDGGTGGSGGASGDGGGAAGAGGSGAADGGGNPAVSPSNAGGCGCVVPAGERRDGWGALLLAAVGAAVGVRRHRARIRGQSR